MCINAIFLQTGNQLLGNEQAISRIIRHANGISFVCHRVCLFLFLNFNA
ncbi:hypothetical protein [Moraxella lacunata]